MTKEKLKRLFELQHMQLVAKMAAASMPPAYSSDDMGGLLEYMELTSVVEETEREMQEIAGDYEPQEFEKRFKAIQDGPERVTFTLDDQRNSTYEVLGKKMTLEEVAEKYLK